MLNNQIFFDILLTSPNFVEDTERYAVYTFCSAERNEPLDFFMDTYSEELAFPDQDKDHIFVHNNFFMTKTSSYFIIIVRRGRGQNNLYRIPVLLLQLLVKYDKTKTLKSSNLYLRCQAAGMNSQIPA